MLTINANTKIATILKAHPDALEAIISISPAFNKLRNPLLRKLMAGRASISMASKIGGCSANDFFKKLEPLGFIIDRQTATVETEKTNHVPEFFKNIKPEQLLILDVRPIIETGKDPLTIILESIKAISKNQVLKLINSFEPVPLIQLLSKQGFEYYIETVDDNTVITYLLKPNKTEVNFDEPVKDNSDWSEILNTFAGQIETIDVRQLEMPLPMLTILDALDNLPKGKALFVYHKRIPVFLLPELAEKAFDYRIKEISDGEVHLLIFKT